MNNFEYDLLDEETELLKDARELIRTLALMYGDKKYIEEAKSICERLTKEIACSNDILNREDEFAFEARTR